jgi:hypothetical protein
MSDAEDGDGISEEVETPDEENARNRRGLESARAIVGAAAPIKNKNNNTSAPQAPPAQQKQQRAAAREIVGNRCARN